MHPARQIRLGAPLLILLLAWSVPLGARPQVPRPNGQLPAAGRVNKEKEARKRPPLAAAVEWTATLPGPAAAGAAFDEARAYVALESGELVAVNLAGGAIAWTVKAGAVGTPAAGGGLVFLPTAGAIEARDATSGQARWSSPLTAALSAPLEWQNGWLLAGTADGAAVMLRADTGELLWQRPLGANLRAGAALTGDRLYTPLENGHVLALELTTGKTVWDRPLQGRPTAIAPLDDRVFVGADDKFFYCLSFKTGKVDWRWRNGGAVIGTPAIDEDNVYFLALDNLLRALDRGNGSQAWHAGVPVRPLAGPFLTGGLLLVPGFSEIRGYQVVDGSEAGVVELGQVLAAPPHFLAGPPTEVRPFVILTREAQLQLLRPTGPPLPSKPFPAKPVYPLWPGTDTDSATTENLELRS